MAIAERLPPLKELTFQVNRLLQQLHKCRRSGAGSYAHSRQPGRHLPAAQKIAIIQFIRGIPFEGIQ